MNVTAFTPSEVVGIASGGAVLIVIWVIGLVEWYRHSQQQQ